MTPAPTLPNELYLLQLEATLYGALMARNLFKSNVTWSSYPFLPPTGAAGFLASLVEGERWVEGNDLRLEPRALHHIQGWEDVWTLGAFPSSGEMTRKHFRAHLGSVFNYEATIWSAGQNEGKKLAVVEEFWSDGLTFLVASPNRATLENLATLVRGKIGPVAKKGCLAISFGNCRLFPLRLATSRGDEGAIGLIPVEDIGQIPLNASIFRVPVSSQIDGKNVAWQTANCLWAIGQPARFRGGTAVYLEEGRAISKRLLEWVTQ